MTFTFLRCGSQIDEASASFTWKEKEKKQTTVSAVAQWRSCKGLTDSPESTPRPHTQCSRVHGSWRAFKGYWITGRLCHKCSFFFWFVCFFVLRQPACWHGLTNSCCVLQRLTGVPREGRLNGGQTRFWRATKTESGPNSAKWRRVVGGVGGGTARLLTPCAACRCDTASGPLDLLWAGRFNQVEGGWQQLFSGKTHQGRTYVIHINSSRLAATPLLPSPPPRRTATWWDGHVLAIPPPVISPWGCVRKAGPFQQNKQHVSPWRQEMLIHWGGEVEGFWIKPRASSHPRPGLCVTDTAPPHPPPVFLF